MIILPDGGSLSEADVLEAMLILARNRAAYPLLTERDWQTACIALVFDALEHRETHDDIF